MLRRSRFGFAAVTLAAFAALSFSAYSQQVELTLMTWYFGEEPANTALRTLLSQFEEQNPDIKVVPENVTSAERFTLFSTRMEGGRGPDLYMETSGNVRAVAARGFVRDLLPFIEADDEDVLGRFSEGTIGDFSNADGQLVFMPYAIGPVALIYNAKHFEEAGLDPDKPPTTWDELLEYARTLTTGGRYGIGLFGKGDGSSVWRFAYWWMTNGANVLDADGNVTVNTPEFIEAMRFWKSLYDEHQVAPPSVPQNSFSENNALFASGVVSMVQSGVWQFGVAYDMNPDLRGHVRAALMPVAEVPVAAGGGDDGIAITTACQHPEEAYRLLKFLSSAEAGRVLWDIQGKFPANLSALDTPEYEDDALVQQWASILPHTRAAVLHERYPEISEVLGVMQQEILLGVKPIEAAVADADRAIRDIVER